MMDQFRARQKNGAVKAAEADGKVADSMDYRLALMERVHKGEITLEQAQADLKKVKRNAKKNGLTTRNSVFVHS
jgi:hypothetical protein